MVLISGTKLKRAVTRMNMNYKLPEGMKTYIPGRSEERRRDFVRKQKWLREEGKIPHRIWIEILYGFVLVLCGAAAVIYLCVSLTLLGWRQSIQSIAVNETDPDDPEMLYTMLQHNGMNSHAFCIIYLVDAIFLFVVSFLSLWFGAFLGNKRWYYYTLGNHAISLALELITIILAFLWRPDKCDSKIFKKHLLEFFRWYGILTVHQRNFGHEAMDKIGFMQGYMGCCGIESWKDYKKLATPMEGGDQNWWPRRVHANPVDPTKDLLHYLREGRDLQEVPHTCCKPAWMHNIYCAEGVFEMDGNNPQAPIAHSRFSSSGCVDTAEHMCERLVYIMTYGFLYLLIFRVLAYLCLITLTYFMVEGNKNLAKTLFLLTEGFQGRNFVGQVKGPEDLNLDLVRHHNDRFKEGDTDWVPPEQTLKGVPKKEQHAWIFGSRDRLASNVEPDWQELARVHSQLSERAMRKGDSGKQLYFGEELDPNLTEEEYYQAVRKGKKIKTKESQKDELLRSVGKKGNKRKAGAGLRKQSASGPKEAEPTKPEKDSPITSEKDELETIPPLDDLGVDIPPLDLFLLKEQRYLLERSNMEDLMAKKQKKRELEEAGNKVPKYLTELPPTPPHGSIIYTSDKADDNVLEKILISERVPAKLRKPKEKKEEPMLMEKLKLPRYVTNMKKLEQQEDEASKQAKRDEHMKEQLKD